MRFGRSYRCYLGYIRLLLWRQLQQYGYILIALGITLAIIGVRQLGGFESLELGLFDSQVRHHAGESGLPEVVVVGITEADIRYYNQWPLSDNTVAELLEHVQGYQPAAIGLDIYRNIEHPPGRQRLIEQLTADNVYVIYDVGLDVARDNPAPEEVPAERWGFADFVADADGVIRRNFMFASIEPDEFYSLGLRLSLHVLRRRYGPDIFAKGWDGLTITNRFFPRVVPTTGSYHQADTAGYQVMLQYQTRHDAIRQVSLRNVLNDEVNPDWFKHKVILIGTVAPSINDLFFTPLNTQITADVKTPGVLVHAQAVSQILSVVEGEYGLIWSWSQWQENFWIGGWCLVGGTLVWRIQRLRVLVLCSAIALLTLVGIGWGLFFYGGWIPVIPVATGFAMTLSSGIAYQVCYRTLYDSLTGLPNRLSGLRHLQRCLDQRHDSTPLVALLLIDLDLFKSVNESLGVTVADQLLKIVAERLVRRLPTALVARVGGDQFAVIVPAVAHTQAAISTAVHLQKRLMDSIYINGQFVSTTMSIGIALHQKGWGYQAHELLQDAHRALAKAKNLGRDRHEVFNEKMRVNSVSQFQLEMELRHAKDKQQFQLYYQPIIDLISGEIAGFEALIRWHHPERGIVPPNDFIGIAEDTGMILSMGEWILNEACHQIRQWQQRFPKPRPLFVGVNLSSRQFVQQDLATMIAKIVQQQQIAPCGLKLELTESVAMEDVDAAIQQLVCLKNKGLQISLDDFGTGYSSLSYLHRLPIDSLKIDKSFVDRMETIRENADIVGTIVSLGHRLQLDIIAEGVETMAQARLLKQLQCQYAQGYFFAKPLSKEQAVQLLRQNQRWDIEG